MAIYLIRLILSLKGYIRSWIYRALIVRMTAPWYKAVLDRIEPNCTVLDVGIGEGEALIRNSLYLKAKKLVWHGIDIDVDYVASCKANIEKNRLESTVTVEQASVYDHKGAYDHIYFSGSFMILPYPEAALKHVSSLLKKNSGLIYFTQTLETKQNSFLEFVKPLLKYFITIDFGQVTYEKEFLDLLKKCDMHIVDHISLASGLHRSSAKLTIIQPKYKNK